MKHVVVNPGVCGLTADVHAEADEEMQVKVTVETQCKAIQKMFDELGDTFDVFEVLALTPGATPLFEQERSKYPIHAACPTLAGITKCIEAEAHMALPRDASITFVDD